MILLLGKNNIVEKYAEETLKVDMGNDIVYYPSITTHYTELKKYINIAKEEDPPVITTQSLEMIDILLDSDLEFDVITVRLIDNEVRERKFTKARAWELREKMGFDLR